MQGSNLIRARHIDGVLSVEIEDNTLQVVATTQEAAEAARDVLEYMRVSVPIEPDNRQLLIGRGGNNVRDIQAKCSLFSINVSDHHVNLVGLCLNLLFSHAHFANSIPN